MAWEVSVGQVEDEGPPIEIVRYEGVVTLSLEQSWLTISSDLPPELVIRAILTPPEWTLRPWSAPSPEQVSLGVATDQLERWALQKFKALFDFAAVLPDGTAEEIERHLLERFPLVRKARGGSVTEVSRYKRIAVHSEILESGEAQWGFDVPEEGEFPPGVPGLHVPEPGSVLDTSSTEDSNVIDLEVFVQNAVRIDLLRRLEAR